MNRRAGVGQEELRRTNLSHVLSLVHVSGPTTRAELTAQLGLNRSTIGGLARHLVDLGLVEEAGPARPVGSGRPSLVVRPRQDVVALAVELGVDRIDVALVALGGQVLERRARSHQRGEHDVEHVVESVAQMSEEVLAAHPDVRCIGAGAAVAGAVRLSDGLVRLAPNLGWVNAPFADLLAARTGLPTSVGNDANLGVLAEHLRGAAVGFDDVAYVNGSVGLGGGFIVGGRPLEGAEGYAGEVGHIVVDPLGPECRCGSRGCWELYVGENHLLTRAGRLPGGGPGAVAEVVRSARAGEQRAAEAVAYAAEWVGTGLRSLVNVFNPEVVVIGGSLGLVYGVAPEPVLDQVRSSIAPAEDLEVRVASLAQDSVLLGAAELAFEGLLRDPASLAPS